MGVIRNHSKLFPCHEFVGRFEFTTVDNIRLETGIQRAMSEPETNVRLGI